MKMLIISAFPSSLINFRGDMIRSLYEKGFDIIALSSGATDEEIKEISKITNGYIDYNVSRNGINPFEDFIVIIKFILFYKKIKPDCVFAYTIKPVIFGGIAARVIGVKNFNALITGLGFAFQKGSRKKNILVNIVTHLYRYALKNARTVIFQNKDNLNYFVDNNIVDKRKCYLVNGSGVNLDKYKIAEEKISCSKFLLIARLLGDKGIREYAAAAALVKEKYPHSEFHLVGPEDPSPDGIKMTDIMEWHEKGTVIYHGSTSDVRQFIYNAGVFVLPSYHEGLPRTVIEAMAMGKPILTTNVPGCRETVVSGINGWLVEKGNYIELSERMCWFIENEDLGLAMGRQSYSIALEKFDVNKVNEELFRILKVSSEKVV
ncbi:glycosyltransferase family 4 protein [Vibrio metoecus]|uniref:glycosyltransferase family 4 protein n=1 Tax=Vibrio metoecus TaxID=1481663 RepID=UPI000BA9CE1D|nr:glycosyltransferase family 4 protein [Vibrio metoecus]PAR27102.1 glycosyltransferase family 1 protein [Vibrio metoecus]PAR35683.1 glycosyltransferase family 1 protein [Vibrio metoecus]PAR44169.1 glycosyltransferase family 1 protein [Vibrio metoecus]PAR59854.1 glycosyltransferase family 1 protein [Vibrio metoecus]